MIAATNAHFSLRLCSFPLCVCMHVNVYITYMYITALLFPYLIPRAFCLMQDLRDTKQ